MLLSICDTSYAMHVTYLVKISINIISVIVPIIIMAMTFKEVFTNVMNPDNTKNSLSIIAKRLIAAFIIFLIPSTLTYVFSTFVNGKSIMTDINSCYKVASLEKVNALKKEEERKRELEKEKEKYKLDEAFEERYLNDTAVATRMRAQREKYESQHGTTTNYNGTTTSTNAAALLNSLQSMSDKVANDKSADWVYINGGESKTFETALQSGNTRTNCAHMVRMALVDIGALDPGKQFYKAYKDGNNRWAFGSGAEEQLKQNGEFITINPPKTPAQLESEGKLLPGDVIGWNNMQHTNVYAGNKTWFDAGRNGIDNKADKNGLYHFSSFGPIEINHYYNNSKVLYIYRLG